MKHIILSCLLALLLPSDLFGQTEFELNPNQTMLMTGKGPGQDGAINPYYGKHCLAIVKNTGKGRFDIRIQEKGEILAIIPISKKEVKKIKLLKSHELYIDADPDANVKFKLDFEKLED